MNYYGVIGNRDYIKLRGEKLPYWHFLEVQPDGWLTSLAYHRKDLPTGKRMIFDCGAWSYKDSEVPQLGRHLVTPDWALEQYTINAKPGDFVVSPDHMLLPQYPDSWSIRRSINELFAKRFLEITDGTSFVPMAVAHGLDEQERIAHATELVAMGYKAISLGGMAGRASAKRQNVEATETIRKMFPDVWLHVLGLSSPEYAGEWFRIGVNSFDGSSHFKQAFTAGAFFTEVNGKLVKFQAAHTDDDRNVTEEITAPLCDCKACATLRGDGIDTRTYGSNENNMGRAAHNQNMLMRAHRWHMRRTYVLVSCVGEKQSEPCKAADLYQSQWFIKARAYAEQTGNDWFILSALYGLVHNGDVIKPYEKTLNTMPSTERLQWAGNVFDQVKNRLPVGSKVIILAGGRYREHLVPSLFDAGYDVEVPMCGLGIGQQLQWLMNHTSVQLQEFQQMTLL